MLSAQKRSQQETKNQFFLIDRILYTHNVTKTAIIGNTRLTSNITISIANFAHKLWTCGRFLHIVLHFKWFVVASDSITFSSYKTITTTQDRTQQQIVINQIKTTTIKTTYTQTILPFLDHCWLPTYQQMFAFSSK